MHGHTYIKNLFYIYDYNKNNNNNNKTIFFCLGDMDGK